MIKLYTDGACVPRNPGPGAWAFVAVEDSQEILRGVGEVADTTNNRMELKAAIEAVSAFDPSIPLILRSDSQYVVDGLNRWSRKWQRNGWQTKGRADVLNRDLWEELVSLRDAREHLVVEWVRGHAGDRWNELADTLAEATARKLSYRLASERFASLGRREEDEGVGDLL